MALFPAYEHVVQQDSTGTDTEVSEKPVWLENSSFKVDINVLNPSQSKDKIAKVTTKEEVIAENKKRKKKHKDRHEKKKKQEEEVVQVISPSQETFTIDKTRNKEFFSVKSIARPSAPRYKVNFILSRHHYKTRKRKVKRYFHSSYEPKDKSNSEDEKITKKDLEGEVKADKNEHFTGFKQEQDMSQTTAFYNRSLSENPHDIDMWIKYVRFQDVVYNFEKSYRKGSIAKGLRVLAERKLAILDKALSQNSDCEVLLRERLNIAVSVFSADELQVQLKKLVEKEPSNIILWQGYIESLQCSMSHCNFPGVIQLYTKCLSTLHQLRRNASIEKCVLEENILRMLYQCGLFLKQGGLFEQLWMLLRLYLELNLTPADKNKFNIESSFNEKQLEELEDTVLSSQLPIHELWLRIEKLRESCHWIPSANENCEDPQRIVFPEDVAELIHPIMMAGNTFKLTATILTLLKTPLLPCRHVTMQELGLDYVPWALDSVENLLPLFFTMYSANTKNKYLLRDTQKLTIGPQYLKTLPAQEEYLEFLLKTIRNCIDCLVGSEKEAITIWWFRFQRLLIILDREERFKMTQSFKKKIKSSIKNFLKEEENRNNIIYYKEYALIELEWGTKENALNILLTTLSSKDTGVPINSITDLKQRAALCNLYRFIVETQLIDEKLTAEVKQTILKYLVSLALGKASMSSNVLTQGSINDAGLKFKHVYLQLTQKGLETIKTVDQFLPNFFTDWVICYGWFLYITEGAIECGTFLENTISALDEVSCDMSWYKEVLFEFYAAILLRHCLVNPGVGSFKLLHDVLHRAIEKYSNNLFLLAVLAKEQSLNCCMGQPLFRISKLLLGTGRAIPSLFLVLIAKQKIYEIEERCVDTITGLPLALEDSYKNRMLSIFKRLTKPDMCTRRCGLVWRLYLQFLYSHFDPDTCRKAYYAAVEECPWLKALYMDAAIYIPAELAQIQDLLIEKQLRIHVTPEELDVLRM